MNRIDLTEPRFTQGDLLAMVPRLTEKTLQNWHERGVITSANPRPGRQGKRFYTGTAVIALTFMVDVVGLGILPSTAKDLAERIAEHALQLHQHYPAQEKDGRLVWIEVAGRPELYHHAAIFKHDEQHRLFIFDAGDPSRTLLSMWNMHMLPHVVIAVAIDSLILRALNKIYEHIAGYEPSAEVEITDPDASDSERESLAAALADWNRNVKPPGGETT